MPRLRLGDILIEAGEITPVQLEHALRDQKETGRPLGMTLVRMGALEEDVLIRTLSRQLGVPMARLGGKRVHPDVAALVPFDVAEKFHCFPLFVKDEADGKALYLGLEDATNGEALDAVASHAGMKVRPVLVATSEIDEALHRQYEVMTRGASTPLSVSSPAPAAADPEPAPLQAPAPSDSGPLPPPSAIGFEEGGALGDQSDLDPDAFQGDAPEFDRSGPSHELGEDLEIETDLADEIELEVEPPLESDAVGEPGPGSDPSDTGGSVSPDVILRSLSQLLVEKGIITREELIERLQRESGGRKR